MKDAKRFWPIILFYFVCIMAGNKQLTQTEERIFLFLANGGSEGNYVLTVVSCSEIEIYSWTSLHGQEYVQQ